MNGKDSGHGRTIHIFREQIVQSFGEGALNTLRKVSASIALSVCVGIILSLTSAEEKKNTQLQIDI